MAKKRRLMLPGLGTLLPKLPTFGGGYIPAPPEPAPYTPPTIPPELLPPPDYLPPQPQPTPEPYMPPELPYIPPAEPEKERQQRQRELPGWYEKEPKFPRGTQNKQWIALINSLLPYFGAEDLPMVARWLYQVGGGEEGPFGKYLREQYRGFGEYNERRRLALAQKAAGKAKGLGEEEQRYLQSLLTGALGMTQRGGWRSRAQELRYQTQLPQQLRAGPQGAKSYTDLLYRLLMPTELTPPPGRLTLIQGRPYIVPHYGFM